ncbi:MAG: hypothetical protein RL885_14240 [Planctomycetota bacterium]
MIAHCLSLCLALSLVATHDRLPEICPKPCANRGVSMEPVKIAISGTGMPCGPWSFDLGGITIGSDDLCPDQIEFSPACGEAIDKGGYCTRNHKKKEARLYTPFCACVRIPFSFCEEKCLLGRAQTLAVMDCYDEVECGFNVRKR